MNERVRLFWLPSLANLLLYWTLLGWFMKLGFRSAVLPLGVPTPAALSLPWLGMLVGLGAAVAYGSRRTGGGPGLRLAVALFPVLAFLGLVAVGFVVSFAVDPDVPARLRFGSLAGYLIGWALLPGAALLAGAVPFLRDSLPAGR